MRTLAALGASVVLLIGAGSASAEELRPAPGSYCVPFGEMTERLAAEYGELVIGRGLNANGVLVELYASADGESWTIVWSRADGLSCIWASGIGKNWQVVAPPATDERAL